VRHVVERVVGVEAEVVTLRLPLFLLRIHHFLEALGLNLLHSIVFVNLVHWNALVLESEEEVDELGYLVGVLLLLLLCLLQLPRQLGYLHQGVQLFCGQ